MSHEEIFESIIERISQYHPASDFSILKEAYRVALEAHGEQIRKSGEPYIIHPLTVAYILADLEVDIESITAGILHDVIEDTKYDYEGIKADFGAEIADLVDGVTRLDKIEDDLMAKRSKAADEDGNIKKKSSKEEVQAENYRKMFIAMAKDIRVILIKIADRLHNVRTLEYMPTEKQIEKAQETLDIYAPLANRLGISSLKSELEDLSFKYLYKEEYIDLLSKISKKQDDRIEYVNNLIAKICESLKEQNLNASVDGRAKHLFSIYRKMMSQGKALDQLYDLFAIRIIVDSIADCYEVLGIVHNVFRPIPGRFKDYIATQKPNMYQSLHTVVIGPDGEPFEIQIRTWDMHKTAEYGIAAHWKYKEGKSSSDTMTAEEEKLAWLRQLLDWQRDLSDNIEFLNELKTDLDIYSDNVHCFTPKGEVINLPNGSTPIDFAYAIHSAVGNKMIGCRVNGIIVPFEYKLNPGDRVTVLTSQSSRGPSHDWLSIAKTNQARTKIRQWFKKENKEENIISGKDLLEKDAKRRGLSLSELLTPERKTGVLTKYGFADWDALCAAVGHGGIRETQVINRLIESYKKEQERLNPIQPKLQKDSEHYKHRINIQKIGITIDGLDNINVRFSKCCSPVPGDGIIGFVTSGNGVSVHRTDCINIINLDEISRQRLVDAEWRQSVDKQESYNASLKITGDDRTGFLFDLSRLLTEEKVPIVDFSAQTNDGLAISYVIVQVESKDQLDKIINKLSGMRSVTTVERASK